MTEQQLFIGVNQKLLEVIEQSDEAKWNQPAPAEMTWQPGMSLRDLINYHAYDDAWVPEVLAGKTKEEVGDKYDGDLLKDDPKGNYRKFNQQAGQAVKNFSELDKTVHLSYGFFRGLRAYDFNNLFGLKVELGDELWQALWDIVKPHEDEWRQMKVIQEAKPAPDQADIKTKFLAMIGRTV
jgi:hypothetical protein